MFDRNQFDRNQFDKQSNVTGVAATIYGYSTLTTNLNINTNFNDFLLKGSSTVSASLVMKQYIETEITSTSSLLIDDKLRLVYRMSPNIQSGGDIIENIAIQTPLGDINFSGRGELIDTNTYVTQDIEGFIVGGGDINTPLTLKMYMSADIVGDSSVSVDNKFKLLTNISGDIVGVGDIDSIRIGGLNTDTIAFTNLGLKSGQTLTIDTDDLDVYIDNIRNVNSVTNDSVFFQLQPGENEITFVSPNNPNLTVTIIYQNRWL